MRVLWLCNIMLPIIAKQLGLPGSNKEGWLAGLSDQMRRQKAPVELGVCFPWDHSLFGSVEGISYYGFPEDTLHPECYREEMEQSLKEVLEVFRPDVVHCFGTEYPHTLAMVRAFGRPERTLIGIQGLCFVYADSYMIGLPDKVQRKASFRDRIKKDDLLRQQQKFRIRGQYEQEALRLTGHVTGRTDWDRFWTKKVNPKAQYHFMNETLRGCFYDGSGWDPENCEKYSIFMSQGDYPIKGLHFMLEALPMIRERFPGVHLYVAGNVITSHQTIRDRIKLSNYGAYLRKLMKRGGLDAHVTFCGKLDAHRMKERFGQSNVFVSPSSIENSPNSVGEAMLLGMPVVSSDVGGVHNLLEHGKEGWLYPREDVQALAERICRIFAMEDTAAGREELRKIGEAARLHAKRTHDPEANYRRLLEIYHEINLCV